MSLRRTAVRAATGLVAASLLVVASPVAPTQASGGVEATGDRAPIFDFSDSYYRTNGVDPAKISGRVSGSDGISVLDTAPASYLRGVRTLLTLPAYDQSGNHEYFTVLGDLQPGAFTADAAGRRAQQLADASPVYVFPVRGGDPTSVGNNRQADLLDMRNGYFSDNRLGLWVHVFVNWTSKIDTTAGRAALARMATANGLALDGTPVIRTLGDLQTMTSGGYVTQTRRATTETGRWFVCPAFKDPRRGAIRKDAFLATVRRTDGSPLPAEQRFVDDFASLQTTGEWSR